MADNSKYFLSPRRTKPKSACLHLVRTLCIPKSRKGTPGDEVDVSPIFAATADRKKVLLATNLYGGLAVTAF